MLNLNDFVFGNRNDFGLLLYRRSFLRLSPSKAKQKIKNKIRENHLHHSNQCHREAVVIRKGTELPEEPLMFYSDSKSIIKTGA